MSLAVSTDDAGRVIVTSEYQATVDGMSRTTWTHEEALTPEAAEKFIGAVRLMIQAAKSQRTAMEGK